MSEPTPKQPDPTRSAVKQPAKGQIPVAKRLEPPPDPKQGATPAAQGGPPRQKSSVVISKSYRVVELPPPPIIAPPRADNAEPAPAAAPDPVPDVLATRAEKRSHGPIELDALQIRESTSWTLLGRHARIPPRWQQWLADPQRRNRVGVSASLAIHVAIILLFAFALHRPIPLPAGESLGARTVEPASESAESEEGAIAPPCEPVVRQAIAGELETVALETPMGTTAGLSDQDAATPDAVPEEPLPKIDPPRRAAEGAGAAGTQARHRAAGSAGGPAPGMAGGSQLPPDLLEAVDAMMNNKKFQRRTPGGRSEGVRYGGGTPQSEEAVERALHWLAIHQRENGGWSFNHLTDACQHYCTHPGSEGSSTAATGMALLPFLGGGYTHKAGKYQVLVQRGLEYLKSRGLRISYGNDLRDGSMYGHALATIALCESFGMTRDEDLREAAQGALDYIAYVQDHNTGGWRYNPGEAGDTTVSGWMIMALKSGQMAHLNVESPAIFAAERFLNSVQNQDGSQYGYQSRKPRPTTTAVGLLCRMYTGWRRDNPGLIKGVAYLSAQGPSLDTLYFDYYATQVLFHWGGPEWEPWNRKMREHLISTQEREGHPEGSWYFESQQSAAGGRLYNTAMAAMILEVYYRFMPLYGEEAVEQK